MGWDRRGWLGLWWLPLAAVSQAFGQGTLEDYQRAERFLPRNLERLVEIANVEPHWIGKENRFWYRRVDAQEAQFILVDAERNTSAPAFDHVRLAEGLSRAAKREYVPAELPFETFEFVEGGKAIRFQLEKTSWTCPLASYACQASTPENPDELLSPNRRWAAVVKDHNLYVRNLSTGQTFALTEDGVRGWDYATPLPSLRLMVEQGTEEVKQPPAVFWAPDSSKLVTYRIDSRRAGRFPSIQFVPPDQLRPKAFTVVYPLPGEALPEAQPVIFDIPSGKRIDVQSPGLELPFQDGPEFDWFPDSKAVFYDYDERGFKSKEIRIVDPETGEQKALVRERAELYVDPGETFYRFDQTTREMLLTSERDGWNHLYLYGKTGQLENQVTQGPWVVREIESVDEKNRRVYFWPADASPAKTPTRPIYTAPVSTGRIRLYCLPRTQPIA